MLTDDDVKRLQKVIVEPLEKRMVSLEIKLDKNTERLEDVETRLGSVETRLDVVEDKVDKLTLDVNAIHIIVSSDHDEFDKRIQRLEKHTSPAP